MLRVSSEWMAKKVTPFSKGKTHVGCMMNGGGTQVVSAKVRKGSNQKMQTQEQNDVERNMVQFGKKKKKNN